MYCPVCKAKRDPPCLHHTTQEVMDAMNDKNYKGKKPTNDNEKPTGDD